MARLSSGTRKRADGTLEKRITIDGKRYSIYGKTNKELAEKEHKIRQDIENGLYCNNKNITLDKYFDEWLDGKRNATKSNSLHTYTSYYKKHISPVLGTRKIQDLERREIIKLQSDVAENLSPITCNMIIKVLKIILNDAIDDEIIVRNPCNGIANLKVKEKATETYHRALTEEEQQAFMKALENDFYYEFIALMLCTGMRCGEVAALQWADVDYKNNVIHITKTTTRTEKGELFVGDTPKTDAGKRDIPMNEDIKIILANQKAKLGNIFPMARTQVFLSVYGNVVENGVVNHSIKNTIKKMQQNGAEIEYFTAHALRDTFATRYIEQNGNPQTLKTILGHSSYSMTMDLYAHVLPSTKQEEMNNIKIVM